MFKHILVPLDGSDLAEEALPAACELASKFESKIRLLRVISPPLLLSQVDGRAYADLLVIMRQQNREEAAVYLKRQQMSLEQQGHHVCIDLVEGESLAQAILEVVEAQGIDAIVMSTHGRGGIVRWVYGSVADKLLRYAEVPILLIRARKVTDTYTVAPIENLEDIRSHEPA